ncbi:hypothetical protein QE152_g5584 [Popillia japonica]|uniref:Secreted protein n=1 Tax=Popillia japonica TaxID=7064 RepID=A0AAW1MP80_POPJA
MYRDRYSPHWLTCHLVIILLQLLRSDTVATKHNPGPAAYFVNNKVCGKIKIRNITKDYTILNNCNYSLNLLSNMYASHSK